VAEVSVAGGRIEPADAPLKIGDAMAIRDALTEALKFRCVDYGFRDDAAIFFL
jgi:hypothetical protein